MGSRPTCRRFRINRHHEILRDGVCRIAGLELEHMIPRYGEIAHPATPIVRRLQSNRRARLLAYDAPPVRQLISLQVHGAAAKHGRALWQRDQHRQPIVYVDEHRRLVSGVHLQPHVPLDLHRTVPDGYREDVAPRHGQPAGLSRGRLRVGERGLAPRRLSGHGPRVRQPVEVRVLGRRGEPDSAGRDDRGL